MTPQQMQDKIENLEARVGTLERESRNELDDVRDRLFELEQVQAAQRGKRGRGTARFQAGYWGRMGNTYTGGGGKG